MTNAEGGAFTNKAMRNLQFLSVFIRVHQWLKVFHFEIGH